MELHNKKPLFPKRPRLKSFPYKGSFAYSLTMCTCRQLLHFKDKDTVKMALSTLKETATEYNFEVYAYCFMPDHLHLLLVGTSGSSDLKGFVKAFKQRSSFRYKQKYGRKLWQPSFYDRTLRKEELLKDAVLYIFNNPVRKNLVRDFRRYPFLGSMVFDINSVM
jgi:putative transposase